MTQDVSKLSQRSAFRASCVQDRTFFQSLIHYLLDYTAFTCVLTPASGIRYIRGMADTGIGRTTALAGLAFWVGSLPAVLISTLADRVEVNRNHLLLSHLVTPGIAGAAWGASSMAFYSALWGVRCNRRWYPRAMFMASCLTILGTALIDYIRAERTFSFLVFHSSAGTPRGLIAPYLREEFDRHVNGTALMPGAQWFNYARSTARLNNPVWGTGMVRIRYYDDSATTALRVCASVSLVCCAPNVPPPHAPQVIDVVGLSDDDVRRYIIRGGSRSVFRDALVDGATYDRMREDVLKVIGRGPQGDSSRPNENEEYEILRRHRTSGGL